MSICPNGSYLGTKKCPYDGLCQQCQRTKEYREREAARTCEPGRCNCGPRDSPSYGMKGKQWDRFMRDHYYSEDAQRWWRRPISPTEKYRASIGLWDN